MDRELLHSYFLGTTTQEEEKRILDWVELSVDNYKEYLREKKLWDALLIHNGCGDIHQANRPAVLRWKIAAVAASIAFLLALAGGFFYSPGQKESIHTVIVPPGQRTQLLLEDGTQIWLNARSTLSYPTAFGKDSKTVRLDGEGYFEVVPDKKRPFIVETEKYNIRVLGTTIDVCAYNNSSNPFELSLLTGKVHLENANGHKQNIHLQPGEYVTEQNGMLQKNKIISMDRFRWKDGLICLDDEPFEALMSKFSEYYDIGIVLLNEKYNTYRCTGTFRMNDGIDYALKVLQRDVQFKYKRNDETHTITIY